MFRMMSIQAKMFSLTIRRWVPAWLGLRTVDVEPSSSYIYGRAWMWSDGVMAYIVVIQNLRILHIDTNIAFTLVKPQYPGIIFASVISQKLSLRHYICEYRTEEFQMDKNFDKIDNSTENTAAGPSNLAHKITKLWSKYQMTECPSGHMTFSFMSCETASNCGTIKRKASCTTWILGQLHVVGKRDAGEGNHEYTAWKNLTLLSKSGRHSPDHGSANNLIAVTVSMFSCNDDETILLYSLVCDFIQHCSDGSDETFCSHVDCPEYTCNSGQCYLFIQKCDYVYHCLDKTDEMFCYKKLSVIVTPITIARLPPPTLFDFDGHGGFTQRPMRVWEECPETHFRCAGVESHCLPVYVRCNDFYDCPGREDEEDCDRYTCPGFYACRDSRACVHADHVCDGWPQCPQRDDELYCKLTCPHSCLCQGMAFLCNEIFPAAQYPETRYLNAGRSKMKPADLFHNTYLIWLSLTRCSIDRVSNLHWPNLIHLDLSHNGLGVVSMDSFHSLPCLRILVLADNPLVSFVGDPTRQKTWVLRKLDLSHTMLKQFNSSALSCYPHIVELNISHSPVDEINDSGFRFIPNLINLDLRGSPVSTFPKTIFIRMDRLRRVFAENYKLCCKATLPELFDERFCFAPEDEISSCDDLLKSNTFRGSLWAFAVLGVIGNIGSFLFRSCSKNSRSGFNVFVTNLTMADFFMGMYLVMIGIADELYRGQYLWYEEKWKNSPACTVAGFLSLLSSEMSAFIICLITLDRFIVLTFPFSGVRFKGRSLAVTCVAMWIGGLILVSVPFFPVTTRWEFYGHTGICIPLPVTRGTFLGYGYAFGVIIVLNFVLFVFIAAGQLSIYWSVQVNSMMSDSNKKSKDVVIARRLFTVAATDFFCWFPIGVLGLMSSNGVPVSSDISVAMVIFILPLNSTLNPFLYTFNVLVEKRKKSREAQLIKMIEAMILSEETRTTADVSFDERR